MYQSTAGRTEVEYRDPPKIFVSLALAVSTVGLVGFLSAVTMAPSVVGAFVAGAVTAALVTFVARDRWTTSLDRSGVS